MTFETVLEALAKDARLGELDRRGAAAIATDAEGFVVYANAAARRLIGAAPLDEAARAALARMAADGSEGELDVSLSAGAAPIAMRARPLGGGVMILESAEEAEVAVAAPDVAGEEGAEDQNAGLDAGASDEAVAAADVPETVDAPAREIAPFRFVFELDQALRLIKLSPELETEVGATATEAVGAAWRETSDRLALDPDGALARAMERRAGWSDLPVIWPDADGRRLELLLSALPIFDRGRTFVGFRGLGRFEGRLAEPVKLAPPAETAPAIVDEPAISQIAEVDEAAAPEPDLVTSEQLTAPVPVADQAPVEPEPDQASPVEPTAAADIFEQRSDEPPAIAPSDDVAAIADEAAPEPSLVAADQPTEPEPVVDQEPAEPESAPAEQPAADVFERPRDEPPPIASLDDVATVEDRANEPRPYAHNVVPLHQETPSRAGALSSTEESAFDEIARRLRSLGAIIPSTNEILSDHPPLEPRPAADLDRAPTRAEDLVRLLDRLPVGALVLRGGAVEHANRAALDMLGHRDLESLRRRGADGLFSEAPPRDDAAPATLRLIAADGVEVDVEARLSTIGWGGGAATLVALRRAESAALNSGSEEREREIAATLDAAVDGVMTLDEAGRILSANRGAETLFGFEARDVVGNLFTLTLAPESRRAAFDHLDQAKAAGPARPEGREVLGLARNGGAIPLHMTIGRIGGPDGKRFCVVLRDVSQWRKAEDDLVVARRQAERANAQKSDFLAKVSHEIRTPLNAIIGFAEVMMEERFGPVGSPRYKDYLKDIHTSGSHLIGLVDDLLDLTRIETGKMRFDFTPVDLNEIAQQAATLLQPQAARGRVIVRTSLARGLPQVLADRRSMRQIMTNLASNAIRFSKPGGQVIVATSLTEIGQAVIRVRDAGLGMSREELARAMEPFRPLAIADNDTGAGLGLPLTKALAEANEAALAIRSEIGQGTLAEVVFPASRVLAG